MAKNHNVHKSDCLSDDDEEAVRQLSGAWRDDSNPETYRLGQTPSSPRTRLAHLMPDAQERLDAACEVHEPAKEVRKKLRTRANARLEMLKELSDGIKTAEDLPEEFIIIGLIAAAQDTSRPSVQLQALKTLAEMKGLMKPDSTGDTSQTLDDVVTRMLERRAKGPRPIGDKKTG